MKLLKYFLLVIGVLGIIASIYTSIRIGTISGQKIGLLCSVFLIYASFRVEKWSNKIFKTK